MKILIADDDQDLLQFVRVALSHASFDVCRAIRERSIVPIMVLTARSQEDGAGHNASRHNNSI